jgi:hypothetical protein
MKFDRATWPTSSGQCDTTASTNHTPDRSSSDAPPIRFDEADYMTVACSMARRIAKAEAIRYSLQKADRRDLRQDLLLAATELSSRYDPRMGFPEPFIDRVMKFTLMNRRRARATLRRRRSLALNANDEKLLNGRGLPLPIVDPVDPSIDPEIADGVIDLPRYLRPLTDDELLTLRAGTEMPMNLAARRRGMAESTFRDQFNRLAARLQAFASR